MDTVKSSQKHLAHLNLIKGAHSFQLDSIAPPVERRAGVSEGVSSNPVRVNMFFLLTLTVLNDHEFFSS